MVDFIYTAQTYGRIIINELCLPYELKSIKPKEIGGIAGGTNHKDNIVHCFVLAANYWQLKQNNEQYCPYFLRKYVAQGILFKLVIDKHKLYQGDHYAMKAASAEFNGLMSYYNCHITGLLTPLVALIDYRYAFLFVHLCRGFRLTAIALLDIDKDTLVYQRNL